MSLTEQEKQVIQNKYIESLKPGQFENTEFLMSEVERLMMTEPVIVQRLLARLRMLNRDKPKVLEAIKSLELKWEVENTAPSNITQKNKSQVKTAPQEVSGAKRYLDFAKKRALLLFVLVPVAIYSFYLVLLASSGYVSQAQLLVQQSDKPMAAIDPAFALLGGLGNGGGRNDTELVKAYIFSADMLIYLEQNVDLVEHYSSREFDYFSRLDADATLEDKLTYLSKKVSVSIDAASSILTVSVTAFDAEFAQALNKAITDRAEWFINEIGLNLAKAQLTFIESEHARVEQRLQEAQSRLLKFQREYNLLDPEAEGAALQQITFALESQIAAKSAELSALKGSMSEQAPMVVKMREQLESLKRQLRAERNRLTNAGSEQVSRNGNEVGVNDILAKFSDYKIDMEFALQSYSASKVSLEASRMDAYQQIKYLVLVESPTLPEDAKYPRVFYNISLLFVTLIIIFGVAKLIIATADELK
ncbi:lipopolysaccharide biosynthesis protein [Glaciecola siphonariae]|uniref:Lipopolysaccharide biosynthesis protein n=1 Tax=Glaciecola siphonariae TaxID=521012 RepID=A0ABV9LU85_9ALTE